DCDAEPNGHASLMQPLLHDPVKHGAHDTAGRRQALLDRRLLEKSNEASVIMEQARAACDCPLRLDLIEQAKPAIGAKGRPGDGDTSALHAPFGIEVDQFDVVTIFGQTNCRGHAADAPAYDQDSLPLCHA